jgi:hypothetical protein
MGQEVACAMRRGKQRLQGRALLETTEVIFRPANGGARLKIAFSTLKSVRAIDGELRLETADGVTTFELGPAAEKWCQKILHPKTRAEKLGVKAGVSVSLLGEFDAEFLQELCSATKSISNEKLDARSELIFLSAESSKPLASDVAKVANSIHGATALWIVYPKGKKEITENDVLTAGRKAGLKDVKVVGLSPTHTALKFVLPLSKR